MLFPALYHVKEIKGIYLQISAILVQTCWICHSEQEEPDLSNYVPVYWLFINSTTSIIDFNCTYLAAIPLRQYPESNDNTIIQHHLRYLSNPPASQRCYLNGKKELKTYPFTWMLCWKCLLHFRSFDFQEKILINSELPWMTFVTKPHS